MVRNNSWNQDDYHHYYNVQKTQQTLSQISIAYQMVQDFDVYMSTLVLIIIHNIRRRPKYTRTTPQ